MWEKAQTNKGLTSEQYLLIFLLKISSLITIYPPSGTLATRMDQFLLQRSWRPGSVHVA